MDKKYRSIYNAAKIQKEREKSAKKPSDYDFGVDSSYIKSFYEDLEKYMGDAEKDYNGISYGSDVAGLYDKHSSTMSSLRDRASNIRAYLNANKKNFDTDTYSALMSDIESANGYFESTGKAFQNKKDFYTAFDTEYDYNAYVMNNTDGKDADSRSARKSANEANTKRIAEIEKQIEDAKNNRGFMGKVEDFILSDEMTADLWGVTDLQKEKDKLVEENNKYNRNNKANDDYFTEYEGNADYKEDSQKRDFVNADKDKTWEKAVALDNTQWEYKDGKMYDVYGNEVGIVDNKYVHPLENQRLIVDPLGLFLNSSEEDKVDGIGRYTQVGGGENDEWAETMYKGDANSWEELYDEEIGMYYYLLNNDGTEKALQYLDEITTELNRRSTNKRAKMIDEADGLEKIALNIASVPANILGGVGAFAEDTVRTIKGEDINPYSRAHSFSNFAQDVRSSTAKDIDELTNGFNIAGLSFGDAYQGIMSGIDSAVGGLTVGKGYSILMGMGAASSEARELYEKGASKWQIIAGGLLAGAAETFFEYMSIETFFKNFLESPIKNPVQMILKTLTQSGVEASEELATTLSNYVTDAVIRGSRSDWEQAIEGFKKNGYSDGKAIWESIKMVGGEALHDAAVGAISGGFMGGVGNVIGYSQYNHAMDEYGQNIIDKDGVDVVKDVALKFAGELGNKGKSLERSANAITSDSKARDIGKLADQANDARSKLNKSDIKSALVEKGVSKSKAENYANVLVAMNEEYFNGNSSSFTLGTEEQWQKMTGDKNAYSVLSEIVTNKESVTNLRNKMQTNAIRGIRVDEKGKLNEEDVQHYQERVIAEITGGGLATDTKNQFETSVDGKTIVDGYDGEVSKLEFTDAENGGLKVKVNGETDADLTSVSFGDIGQAYVVSAIVDMGVGAQDANSILNMFKGKGEKAGKSFANGISLAFKYGRYAFSPNKLSKIAGITKEQAQTAYAIGKTSRTEGAKTAQSKLDSIASSNESKGKKAATKGSVVFEGDIADKNGNLAIGEDALTDVQRASVEGIRLMAKLSPLNFHIFQSTKDGDTYTYVKKNGQKTHANGWYRVGTNDIYIDLNAGAFGQGAMIETAAHEISHFIKEFSPEKWNGIAEYIMNWYTSHYGGKVETLLLRQIEKVKSRPDSKKKTTQQIEDEAFEELVCDSLSRMLVDGTVVEAMATLNQKNKGLWNTIKEAVMKLLENWGVIIDQYKKLDPNAEEATYFKETSKAFKELQKMFTDAFADAGETYNSIGARDLTEFAGAKTTEGEELFQYRAMEADKDIYRDMLKTANIMTNAEISSLFETIDSAMDIIVDNLEVLDYAWDADIDDRAYNPVKKNTDKLYKVSVDFSTLCRKRLLQQTVQSQLQEALNRPLNKKESIAIRDALMAVQEEGKKIEIACALCYVESARMKSPEQIKRFINDRETVVKDFFAKKSDAVKAQMEKAELDARKKLGVDDTPLTKLPQKQAKAIRQAKKDVVANYVPTAKEQAVIDVATGLSVSDFTTPEGLENLARNHKDLYDAYTSYIVNATHAKGIENDTWWRAGDSSSIGDTLIANMNAENGLRSQSWSDFQVIHLLDYIAATIELSTRKAKMQAYSKVADYVELMGNTGQMINISLIPTREFTGTLDYDSTEGMEYKRALELRKKYHATAGTICIGVDNTQIQMLLADANIDYVIPYHRSGMAKAVRKAMHIPTWSEYENYQSEKNLSREDAKKQAEKYGVQLLAESDANYHKNTSFSEWFDIDVAKQIAKMENATPSNKAMQKKYGVMYGGYMAMQNAADTYLKLCAERGLAPVFSNEKADFTGEDNYWKLLIDRKMVDNVTGEIIEQQAVKPVFDQTEVLRILNDELERYPGVKADQEYATRKVVEGFLSGKVKGGMSSKAIADVMKAPVDNISETNILSSSEAVAEYGEEKLSSRRETSSHINDAAISDAEYSKLLAKKAIKTSNATKGKIGSQRTNRYSSLSEDEIPLVDIFLIADYHTVNVAHKYTIRNDSKYHFTVIRKQQIHPDSVPKGLNKEIEEAINRARTDKEISRNGSGSNDNSVRNTVLGDGGKLQKDEAMASRSGKSDQERYVDEGLLDSGRELKLSDRTSGYVETDSKAVMTTDRIDYLIEDSGAGSRVDYANYWITSISPTDFLNMTLTAAKQDRSAFDKFPSEWNENSNMDTYDYMGELKKNMRQTPYLAIDITTGEVVGHEGRHRMRALERSGIKSAEIRVEFRDEDGRVVKYSPDGKRLQIKDAVKIINQFGTGQTASINNVIPLNKDYRDTILANYGESTSTSENDIRYSERVTDKKTLDFLNEQIERGEYITVYRSFQIIDGGLYAPMNAVDRDEEGKNKKLGYRSEIGQWEKATESLSIAQRYMEAHPDAPYAKFNLDGVDNKTNDVAYNPYLHASNLVLNDQFAAAYRRNLVTVECRVPLSEAGGAYKAEYAKDGTGWANWKAGAVAGQLKNAKPDFERKLFLSRYMLPVRILSDAEVAKMYKEYLDGTDVSVPWNVVTPSLRNELEKAGVNISYDDVNRSNGPLKFADQFPEEASKVLYQDRDTNSISTRSLLANALESTIDTSTQEGQNELRKLTEYKEMIGTLDDLNAKLNELRAGLFTKGVDGAKRKQMQEEATKIANRISIYDKKLLTLEASKPLKKVLEREKAQAVKRQKKKDAEAIKAYRERAEEKLQKQAEHYRESRKAAVEKLKESKAKSEARNKLQKLVLETAKWISYPKKDEVKCPDILRVPYADFLQSIDFSSKTLLEKGEQTKNDLRVASSMDSLATAIERVKNAQNPTVEDGEVLDSGYLDLPAHFVDQLREMAEKTKMLILDGEYVVNRMSADDVKQLTKLIRTLNHSIREMSTLYSNMRFANVEQLGDNSISFMEELGEIDGTNSVADFATWDNALPYYTFKRFGDGGESVFEELMDAQDTMAFHAKTILDFREKAWTSKEAKEWSEDTHTIELPSRKTLTLTTADAMSIYCLARRDNDQGLNHLVGGGVRVLGEKKGAKASKDSRANLDLNDVLAICNSLNDRQKAVAEAIQEFMSTVCSEWGNEISMKRFLTKDFTEKRYFPIQSNDEVLAVKDPQAQQSDLYRLLNISATKPLTPKANNSVIIRNIFDVFTEHTSDMAKLNAYGMALLDYMKWINYSEKSTNDDGQISVRGIRKAMNNAYGNKAMSYVINLIKDINGRFNDGGDHPWLMKMTRNAKTAAVGSSLRVAALQFTAYPRAAMVLSTANLAKGLMKRPQISKAKEYCGIALWKSFGFYDTNISRSIEDQIKGTTNWKNKLVELSLKGAEWGDSITWGYLWNACEYDVANSNKQLKIGTEEFNQAVAKRLREVVYSTQVVDSVLTRTQLMRNKSGLTQMATAFMSEPAVTYNILMDAGYQFRLEQRRTGSKTLALQKTGGKIMKAVTVYGTVAIITSLVESIIDAYRDDEDEEFFEKFGKALLENSVSNIIPFNKLPFAADVVEMILSWFGMGYFSTDRLDTTWLTDIEKAGASWIKVFGEAFGTNDTSVTVYKALYDTVKALSSTTGVAYSGILREVVALWNNTIGAVNHDLKIKKYED